MFSKVVFSVYSHLMTHYMKRICYRGTLGYIVLGSTRSAEWSSPKCKWHQTSRKSLHRLPSIFLVKCLLCCFAHSCPQESWTGIFSEMEWEKQTKREICRKVLGRTLEAAKSWIERWWAETSEGTISVQMASWIFHMRVTILGEAEVLQRLFLS